MLLFTVERPTKWKRQWLCEHYTDVTWQLVGAARLLRFYFASFIKWAFGNRHPDIKEGTRKFRTDFGRPSSNMFQSLAGS